MSYKLPGIEVTTKFKSALSANVLLVEKLDYSLPSANPAVEVVDPSTPASPAPETPNAPILLSLSEGSTEYIFWSFDHGSFPVAEIEIWRSVNGSAFGLVVIVPSASTSRMFIQLSDDGDIIRMKLRYKDGATYGPFSNILQTTVST